jgi:hypothetical protein
MHNHDNNPTEGSNLQSLCRPKVKVERRSMKKAP